MDSNDKPDQFGLDKGYVALDGEYLWPTEYKARYYERNLEAQIVYVETLCRVVPSVKQRLQDRLLNKQGSASLDEIIDAWKNECHLDAWVGDKVIAYYGDEWPEVYRWLEDKRNAQEKTLGERWYSPHDASQSITFTVAFYPFLDRLKQLKKQAHQELDSQLLELENEIKAEAEEQGWKQNRSRRRGRHNPRSIRRHFEWLALYQSGESEKGYQAIANRVDRESLRVGSETQRGTIWKAIQKLAKDLDIDLKRRPPGRPKGSTKKTLN